MDKYLGKITKFRLGWGGYQDAMFGFTIEMGGSGWSTSEFHGMWSGKPSEHAKWTEESRIQIWGECMAKVHDLLSKSKRRSIEELVGVPVECTFEIGGKLAEWRVLEEVL